MGTKGADFYQIAVTETPTYTVHKRREIYNYYGQEPIALWSYPKNGIDLFGGNFIPHSIAKSKADAQWNPWAWAWFTDR